MSIIDVIKILFSKVLPLEKTWDSTMENVVFRLRLPRILAAFMVGSALAISGATYQGMFKNPLVSPDLLGVSSGACVGAALAILAHLGTIGIQIGAFLGGVLAVTITITMPKLIKNNSSIMLVLAGVIVGGFMSSIMGLLKYVADPETELAEIVYWTLGSLAKVDKGSIAAVAPAIIIAGAVLMAMRWKLNILSLGENEARTLGTNVNLTRGIAIVCSTVLTAFSVCLSGTIGWVGLVVPHLGRMLVGPDNTKMLPVTLLLGGAFMVFVDTLARTLTGAELPLSILTGLIGAPFYFWLLVKQRMNIQ
ncbi:MAG TPA: iron ABC transporter permease [Peptococcaceae bacterium]|nr:iron ABC transporter permease [Peptococcaceae bacterium]